MRTHRLSAPIRPGATEPLSAGDRVLLSGTVYTARDAAHERLARLLAEGGELPFDPKGAVVYYVGPSPAPPGMPVGSAGPTTSYRMDPYTPPLLRAGVRATVGKGPRGPRVRRAMLDAGAVYLAAIGGAAACMAEAVVSSTVVAYPELGAEAVRRLEVSEMPLFVVNDLRGGDLFEAGVAEYGRRPRLHRQKL